MSWIAMTPQGAIATVHVVPRASRTEVCGTHGEALKIRLQAPPVEGKANKALARFLAGELEIRAADVEILAGLAGRDKRILLRGVDAARARRVLKA